MTTTPTDDDGQRPPQRHARRAPPGSPASSTVAEAERAGKEEGQPRRRLTRRGVAGRFRAVIELAPDATIVADAYGRIRLTNRQTEVLFGYDREALLGQSIDLLIPERFRRAHEGHRSAYVAAPQLFGRRRDGTEFPVEVSLGPLADDASRRAAGGSEGRIIASIRDVGELQRVQAARAAAEAANLELQRLQALTDTALAHRELDALLPELLERLRDALGADNAAILLLDPDGRHLRVRASRGPEEEVATRVRAPLGQGFAGRIAATRQPLIVDDLASFPVVNPFLWEALRSVVGVPLLLGEWVLGTLHVGAAEPHRFAQADVQLLQRAAERVALAIERAQLYEAEQAARWQSEAEARRPTRGNVWLKIRPVSRYRAKNCSGVRNAAPRVPTKP